MAHTNEILRLVTLNLLAAAAAATAAAAEVEAAAEAAVRPPWLRDSRAAMLVLEWSMESDLK